MAKTLAAALVLLTMVGVVGCEPESSDDSTSFPESVVINGYYGPCSDEWGGGIRDLA